MNPPALVLLACATTLFASGFLYGDTVALGGVRRAVLAAPAADRGILVRMSVPLADLDTTDAIVRAYNAASNTLTDGAGVVWHRP